MNRAGSGGLTTGGALALLFIALKLCHVVAWSWWWVLAPVWIPTALVALVLVAYLVAYLIAAGVDARDRRRRIRKARGGIRPGQHGPDARWPR